MKRITQFILCLVLAVSAYGQGVGGNSVPRTVSGISNALDLISSTQGTVFYRGASGWEALTPGTSGQLLSTQGAAANPIWVTATGGAGDMNGPASATDNAIVRFDGTGGKTVQNSAVTIADTTGSISINGTETATAVNTGGFRSANFGLSTTSGGASYFGGALSFSGNTPSPTADGQGYAGSTSSQGFIFQGRGSTNDFNLYNKSGSSVLSVATGTQNVNLPGTTSASSSTVGALTIGNGTAATNVAIGGGNVNAGGTITAGGAATFAGAVTATLGTNYPPQTAPASPASGWVLYTDSGDGNKLKAKASTGTVVTIGTP